MATSFSKPSINSWNSHKGTIIIPGNGLNYAKIIIIDDDSVSHTVMDTYSGASADNYSMSAQLVRNMTNKLSNFTLKLINDNGRWLNKFDGGEIVKIYADDTDATTLLFYGRIDNVNYGLNPSQGFFVEIDGRDKPEMVDKTIIGVLAAATPATSIANILYDNYNDVKIQYWNGTAWVVGTYVPATESVSWSGATTDLPTIGINMTFQHKKGLTVISEILQRADMDSYFYYDESASQMYLRIFNEEAIVSTRGISYGTNLKNVNRYGSDTSDIKNRVITYGKKESDNILLMKTEEDSDSQDDLWVKDLIINDSSIESMDEVEDKAEFELAQALITTPTGTFTAIDLLGVNPGEMMECIVPFTNINGLHKVASITHNIGNSVTSTVQVHKQQTTLNNIFVGKLNPDDLLVDMPNVNAMKDSFTVYFETEDSDQVVHDGTQIVDGILKLQSSETSGDATSVTHTADYNVTECEFRRYENYTTEADSYDVSNNAGITWENYVSSTGGTHEFTTTGSGLRFRINFSRTSTSAASGAYESVALLYK